jgi:toxin ParE1/3/4
MRVKWRLLAEEDYEQIVDYIAKTNLLAAIEVGDEIMRQVEGLEKFPESGRLGRIQGTRELVIGGLPYVVPYRIADSTIEILRVFHTSRLWPVQITDLECPTGL